MRGAPQPAGLEPHPWNRGFDWPRHPGPYRLLTDEQARHYDERGFVLLEDAVDPATLRRVVQAIDPLEARAEAFLRSLPGGRAFIADAATITFTINCAAKSPLLRAFVSGPPFRDVAHDLIGPDVRLFWDQAVYKKTEAPRPFPWHQDNGYGFVEPQCYLTCWLALGDSNERNGCPRVLPGLHRRGTLRHDLEPDGWTLPIDEPGEAVPMRAGSLLVFSSLTPHTTGPNLTASPRKAYIVQYTSEDAAYLRGEPGQGPPTHREAVRDLPAERQWEVLRGGE